MMQLPYKWYLNQSNLGVQWKWMIGAIAGVLNFWKKASTYDR